MTFGIRAIQTGRPRHVIRVAMAAALLASCAGPEKAAPRGPAAAAGFRPVISGDPAALDRLEKVARNCGLKGIRRDGAERWLSFDTPAHAPRRGDPFRCFMKWTLEHPETQWGFVGNEARE
jgi:hypothetical protein